MVPRAVAQESFEWLMDLTLSPGIAVAG